MHGVARVRTKERDQLLNQVVARPKIFDGSREDGDFFAEVWRRPRAGEERQLIERFLFPNLVTDQGLTYRAGSSLLGVTQITTWYILLVSGTPTIVAADTYASHAGWTEIVNYDEATREVWTGIATGTAGETSNAAAVAEFTISTGGATVGGAGFVGGGTDPTVKGNTAGGGTLFSASAFSGGNRTLLEDDLLRITYIQRCSRP